MEEIACNWVDISRNVIAMSDVAGKELMRVSVYNGKYTVIQDADGSLRAERYGLPWRDCTGDNLIWFLAREVEALRAVLKIDEDLTKPTQNQT